MPFCSKCSTEVTKVHQCEHTDDKEYCVECYTELHYYITEKNQSRQKNTQIKII